MKALFLSTLAVPILMGVGTLASAETSQNPTKQLETQSANSDQQLALNWGPGRRFPGPFRRGPWGGWRRGPIFGGPGFCYYHPYAPRCRW